MFICVDIKEKQNRDGILKSIVSIWWGGGVLSITLISLFISFFYILLKK